MNSPRWDSLWLCDRYRTVEPGVPGVAPAAGALGLVVLGAGADGAGWVMNLEAPMFGGFAIWLALPFNVPVDRRDSGIATAEARSWSSWDKAFGPRDAQPDPWVQ